MKSIYERMKQYSVSAKSPSDFLERYTRPGYGAERGKDYQQARIESANDDLKSYGYCMLSAHESKTGEIVSWFPDAQNK